MINRKIYIVFYFLGLFSLCSPATAAEQNTVAIHVSENTRAQWPYTAWKYWHTYRFLEESLKSDGTPFVEISDAAISANGLFDASGRPKYPILISLGNETIPSVVAGNIRRYVSSGGRVYVGSSSWTRDETGKPYLDAEGRPNFALADAMGLNSRGWVKSNAQATRISDSLLLDSGLIPLNVPVKWFMPLSYDLHNLGGPWGSLYDGPHWVWAASPSASNPATGILASPSLVGVGFLPSTTYTNWTANDDVYYGDVNGDGKADTVGRDKTTSGIRVGLSNGQEFRAFTAWKTWNLAYDVHVADVTGDRKAEIIGRIQGGNDVQVGLSTGATFEPSTQWIAWDPSYSMDFSDLNGDGKSDIVGRVIGGTDVFVGLSVGIGFSSPAFWAAWDPAYDMHFSDVNGDGRSDIVGRLMGGSDVRVGLSTGSGFQPSVSWGMLDPNYDMHFSDTNGDGKADIMGRYNGGYDVQVGLSTGAGFSAPASWTTWGPSYDIHFADVNGDGNADILGRKNDGVDVQVGFSSGGLTPSNTTSVLLAEKFYGSGKFIFNGEFQPLSSYGGDAKAFQYYRSIRTSIDDAFKAQAQPLVRLSAWPYPYKAGFIFRHDHWLNLGIVDVEYANGVKGEYYIQPDNAGPDYPGGVGVAKNKGAIIGSHILGHRSVDWYDYADALAMVQETNARIKADTTPYVTNGITSTSFVAPFYEAIRRSSMQAIWDAGLKTTGEQGFGPFPSFALDTENEGLYVNTLLQLPVGGVINQQPMTDIEKEIDFSYSVGGLINVYDHAGAEVEGGYNAGVTMAQNMLSYALNKPNVWKTNSGVIRDWWLQRERRRMNITRKEASSFGELNVSIAVSSMRASTTYSDTGLAIRVNLPDSWLAFARKKIAVTLNGKGSNAYTLQGNELMVRIGAATSIKVRVGV